MNDDFEKLLNQIKKEEEGMDYEKIDILHSQLMLSAPLNPVVYLIRGDSRFERGNYTEALKEYDALLSCLPSKKENPEAGSSENVPAAKDFFDRETMARIYLKRGQCFRYAHMVGPALTEILRAREFYPEMIEPRLEEGYLWYMLNEDDKAEKVLKELLALDHDDFDWENEDEVSGFITDIHNQAAAYLACLYYSRGDTEKSRSLLLEM